MLVVSAQLHHLGQATVQWLRVGKSKGKYHSDSMHLGRRREFCEGVTATHHFWVLRKEGVTAPGAAAGSAPPNMTKAQMQTLWPSPTLIHSQTLIKNGE